ncbi:ROK family transcriptional regulator, partial [Weissella hellenica]
MKDQGMKSIQKNNFSETFHLFFQHDRVSKQVISDNLGHSLPTITSNLKKLLDRNLIIKDGEFTTQKTGRPAQAYELNNNAFISLGMAIFGDYVLIVALNARGELFAECRSDIVFKNIDNYYYKISQVIKSFITRKNINEDCITGLGIGIQGLVSQNQKKVIYSQILPMQGVTTDVLQQYLSFPVSFLHDADAVALAEERISTHHEDAIYLSIGPHLGTAMMVDGKIYNGSRGRSGTMEHITIAMSDKRLCYCGRYNCIETYIAINALISDDKETLSQFFNLVDQGDAPTLQRWHQYLDDVSEAIMNLHMFVDSPIVLA